MAAHRPLLADLDSVLGPVASAYRDSTPRVTALALAARAHSAGILPGALRTWVVKRTKRDDLVSLAKQPATWRRITDPARKHAASVSLAPSRARLRKSTARALVAQILSPLPEGVRLSTERTVRARHALAIVGAEFLHRAEEDGYNTVVMSAGYLAVLMGCTPRTATSALSACVDAGWLRKMPSRRGAPARYKLARLSREQNDVAWEHEDFIDALAEGDKNYPAAEVFALASHPAVGYGIGHYAWLVGLCDEAGVDPVEVGMTKRTLRKYRSAWIEALAADPEGQDLSAGLDAWAEMIGAQRERQIALGAYEAQRVARIAEVAATRERRAKVREGLDALLAANPVPHRDAPAERRNAWLAALTQAVAESGLPDEMRKDFTNALASKLRAKHYPDHVAAKVAERVTDQPASA